MQQMIQLCGSASAIVNSYLTLMSPTGGIDSGYDGDHSLFPLICYITHDPNTHSMTTIVTIYALYCLAICSVFLMSRRKAASLPADQ